MFRFKSIIYIYIYIHKHIIEFKWLHADVYIITV